ncbi:hybrid sensor histidine kinase/response regulator [Anaerolineales bacterium HSG24]|nr:hybrid sensor histidine kinase/response regulator [Anaerolineales bacterium HSG24]
MDNLKETEQSTVMVIDDASDNRHLLGLILKKEGFKIMLAKDGETGLAALAEELPDIILLDIMMPDMSGYDLCEKLKADEQLRDIPVIFISAMNQSMDKVKAFSVGGVDYIIKPFNHTEVIARVNAHLDIRRLQNNLKERNLQLSQEITERKAVEEALQLQNKELDAFSHTVAHDLKGPLGIVVGYTDYLINDPMGMDSEELRPIFEQLRQAGQKATNIIDELLLLAGVRKKEVEPSPVNMLEIVCQTKNRLKIMIEEYKAEVTIAEDWPIVIGYAPWLEEVWANYISNALKYGGSPPSVKLGYTELDDSTVRLWVRDNGMGLSEEQQLKLFTEFTRLGEIRLEGNGLGLSIVRRIMNRLNGEVGVESTVGHGSEFYFVLPKAY